MSALKDSIVPNRPGMGSLGLPQRQWGAIHAVRLLVNGAEIDPRKVLGRYLGTWPRGENISGARAVCLKDVGGQTMVYLASCLDPDRAAHGFVIEAGNEGEDVAVWASAVIPGLSYISPESIYVLGASGEFSATLHADAVWRQVLGIGLTGDSISANVQPAEFIPY